MMRRLVAVRLGEGGGLSHQQGTRLLPVRMGLWLLLAKGLRMTLHRSSSMSINIMTINAIAGVVAMASMNLSSTLFDDPSFYPGGRARWGINHVSAELVQHAAQEKLPWGMIFEGRVGLRS